MAETDEISEIYKTMNLALRIGEVLLSSGAGAADVRRQMDNVAVACGLRGFSVDVTFTELSMSYQIQPDEPALQQMRQVRYRQVDFDHLTRVDHLVRALAVGRIERDDAATELNRITSSGHSRPRWAVNLGLGVMGAGVGLVLGGQPIVVAIAFVGACGIDQIQRWMTRRRWPTFYQQVAGGLFATLLAAAVAATGWHVAPSRVISSAIILLLAGVSFLGAIQDALTGFPLTASARLLEAIIATAGAIAGVSAGLTIASVAHLGLGKLNPAAVTLGTAPGITIGAALAAAAYAYSSYVPYRGLLPIAIIAAGAATVYRYISVKEVGIAFATAIAAVIIGLVSYSAAGRFRIPALVIVTAAIIPLLPGLTIFRALVLFTQSNGSSSQGIVSIVTAVVTAIALSSGVILGQYIAQPVKREARRLETRLAGPRLVGPPTVRAVRRRNRKTSD